MENSTDSAVCSKCSSSTVLLKADTGADMNLMNNVTFDSLFDRSVLQPTPIRMENYGNTSIKVLGKFIDFSDVRTGCVMMCICNTILN